MSVAAPAKSELQPAFARHETFHPRYGWLKKGFDAAAEDGGVFNRNDATTRLGVGKNMVRAIRYWCLAYKILEEQRDEENSRLMNLVPSEFGEQLLADDGWDLIWRTPDPSGSCTGISSDLRAEPRPGGQSSTAPIRPSSATKRCWRSCVGSAMSKAGPMWLTTRSTRTFAACCECTAASPRARPARGLGRLAVRRAGAIRPMPGDARAWNVNSGPKQSLPDEIVVYACLDYAHVVESGAKVLGVGGLARNEGSPGRAFALTETALGDALGRFAEEQSTIIELTHAAGNRQLVLPDAFDFENVLDGVQQSILDTYYARRLGKAEPK